MNDFPKMLYRFPATGLGTMTLEGSAYDTCAVSDEGEQAEAEGLGWRTVWPDAKKVHEDAQAAAADAQAAADAAAKPTRAELEQKATELQITFTDKTSDKKLADLIRATLET